MVYFDREWDRTGTTTHHRAWWYNILLSHHTSSCMTLLSPHIIVHDNMNMRIKALPKTMSGKFSWGSGKVIDQRKVLASDWRKILSWLSSDFSVMIFNEQNNHTSSSWWHHHTLSLCMMVLWSCYQTLSTSYDQFQREHARHGIARERANIRESR